MSNEAIDTTTTEAANTPATNPLENYRWYKGSKVQDIANLLNWSLYKTRVVLRGDRPVKPEEISHISICTDGAVEPGSWETWNKWVKTRNPADTPDTGRLKRMRAGDSRAKGKPVSVILFEEHVTHLKSYADMSDMSFSAVVRKIVDEYFSSTKTTSAETVEPSPILEQDSSYSDDSLESVGEDGVVYDEAWLSDLVDRQGTELDFDAEDVRRFLKAKNKKESGN